VTFGLNKIFVWNSDRQSAIGAIRKERCPVPT